MCLLPVFCNKMVINNLTNCLTHSVVGRSIGLHRSALLDPDAILFSCAEIKLVELNDASFDIVVAFPDTPNFER